MLGKFKIRFSMGMKSALNIIFIAIIIGGAAVTFSYRAYRNNLDNQMIHTASNLAVASASQIEPNSIDRYLASGKMDDEYERVLNRLQEIQEYYGIVAICCFKPTSDGFYVVYNTDQREDALKLGEVQKFTFQEFIDIENQLLAGEDVPTIRQESQGSDAAYALAAIRNEAGETKGYMAVIFSMKDTVDAEHNFLFRLIALLLCITALLAVLSVLFTRFFLVRPLNQLSNIADCFVEKQKAGLIGPDDEKIEIPQRHTGDEMERLYCAVRQMEQSIYNYIGDLTRITAEKERISTELSVATKIQGSMLPCIFPPFSNHSEFDLYATMTPAKEVGGDFYDFFLVDDDHLALIIADVSGKGIPAALFMVITKVLLKNSVQTGKSPKDVFAEVNSQLCADNPIDMFVTVWLGILEISTGKLTCANAGHEYPAVCRADGTYELIKDPHGLVLACMDGSRYKNYELQLNPGDTLFVYTDGVAEATDSNNQLFGTERMLASLNRNCSALPNELLPQMKQDIDAFVGDAPQFDDITMLGIRYLGDVPPETKIGK
jgi:phosphoserine phosphatase RsbU/P